MSDKEEVKVTAQHIEGSPWFWKLFGGALIGLTTLLLAVILNSLTNSVSSFRSEITSTLIQMKEENVLIREKLAALNQARDSGKERYADLDRLVKINDELLRLHKEKIALLEAGLKERQTYSEENVKTWKATQEKLEKEIADLKKEHADLKERILRLETKTGKN
jgi:predicted  nucleic acid-binding Zn-ribbon protein